MKTVLDGVESCYQLEKGSCGLLARAECQKTRKKCWIQAFERKRNESDEERGQQLQRVRSLDHPNILKVLDLFQDEAHFYAVYEATEGDSAEELCARTGGVSEQWTAAIMRQVFAALSHCHSKGLLLKTLSAKHVLFTETPMQEHTSVKLLIPIGEEEDSYLAPELKSRAYIGPANDLGSCGVLISTLLAGEYVILKMQASFTSQEFRGAYKKWQEASQKAKCFTLALMTNNYSKRPTVEKCLQHPWLSAAR
jgi:calcium-dependent protein kinase